MVVGLLWLVPTIGLFITSILPGTETSTRRLVEDLRPPEPRDVLELQRALPQRGLTGALKTTAYVAVGNTVLVVIVAALAGYAFAWLEFPGRDWLFICVIGLLVVPLQMALIPMFRLYDTFGIGGTGLSVILFHAAFGLPFAVFSCATSSSGYRRTSSSRPASTVRAKSGFSCA